VKKVLIVLASVLAVVLPTWVIAGFTGDLGVDLHTRLEGSSDNSTWLNYTAEDNPGDATLSVSAGDTVYLRLKTWDTSDTIVANSIVYSGTFTNPQYVNTPDFLGTGTNDDLDGDGVLLYSLTSYDSGSGSAVFGLNGIYPSSTVDTDYESGGITFTTDPDTPDQTVILATVQITSAEEELWISRAPRITDRALADDPSTTRVRILVNNPTATPTPTPTSTATATVAVSSLPETGPNLLSLIYRWLAMISELF